MQRISVPPVPSDDSSVPTSPLPSRKPRFLARFVLPALCLLLLAAAPYFPVVTSGYFLADDFGYISLYSKTPVAELGRTLAEDWAMGIFGQQRELRPLIGLSYKLDYTLFGVNAHGFLASNLAWHVATVFLLFFVAGLLTADRLAAFLCAAIFATMPVHAEAVSWIAGRTDLISAFFALAAVLFFCRFLSANSLAAYVMSLLCFGAGLLSKESVVILPLIVLALLLFRPRNNIARANQVLPVLPFFAILAAYLLLRHFAFGNPIDSDVADMFLFLKRMPSRLALLLMPASRDFWNPHLDVLAFLSSAATAVLISFFVPALWRDRRALLAERRALMVGIGWFAVALLPLAARGGGGDRNLYLPSAGFCLAAGPLAALVCRRRTGIARGLSVSGVVAFLLISSVTLAGMNLMWVRAGKTSEKLQHDFAKLESTVPRGSFVVFINPPPGVYNRIPVWDWALPFALSAPFSHLDTAATIIETPEVYCCPINDWWQKRQARFRELLSRPAPVYLVLWDDAKGLLRIIPVSPGALSCLRASPDVLLTRATALGLVPSLVADPIHSPAFRATCAPHRGL